jgi:aldehyde dehydrogenase (NAD+)
MTWRVPHGVTGHIMPVELPGCRSSAAGGRRAGRRQCLRGQAVRRRLPVAAAGRPAGGWKPAFRPGALNIVTGYGYEVGDALARHPGIDHISFTGSPRVGTLMAAGRGRTNHVPGHAGAGRKSRRRSCLPTPTWTPPIAGGRQRHHPERRPDLLGRQPGADRARSTSRCSTAWAPRSTALRVGPAAMDLDLGPLIRESQLPGSASSWPPRAMPASRWWRKDRWWRRAPRNRLLPGADAAARRPRAHRLAQEEVFGPVLAAMAFADEDQAVALANATRIRTGRRRVDTRRRPAVPHGHGACAAARSSSTTTVPAAGGTALRRREVFSGYGREKGFEALYGFTTLKTVAMRHG